MASSVPASSVPTNACSRGRSAAEGLVRAPQHPRRREVRRRRHRHNREHRRQRQRQPEHAVGNEQRRQLPHRRPPSHANQPPQADVRPGSRIPGIRLPHRHTAQHDMKSDTTGMAIRWRRRRAPDPLHAANDLDCRTLESCARTLSRVAADACDRGGGRCAFDAVQQAASAFQSRTPEGRARAGGDRLHLSRRRARRAESRSWLL